MTSLHLTFIYIDFDSQQGKTDFKEISDCVEVCGEVSFSITSINTILMSYGLESLFQVLLITK